MCILFLSNLTVFKEQGVDFSMPLVTSCQTGMTATSLAFALELVGLKDVPVYAVRNNT